MDKLEDICREVTYFADKRKDYDRRMRDAEHRLIKALELNPLDDLTTTIGDTHLYKITYIDQQLEVAEIIEPSEPVTMKHLEDADAPEWAKAAYKASSEEE